jgi:Flp pilus assembly protein TadG
MPPEISTSGRFPLVPNVGHPDMKVERVCRPCRLSGRQRRGAAVVEGAIAAVTFLMVLGIIALGCMVAVQRVISEGSREGRQIAILDEMGTTHLEGAVDKDLSNATIGGANVTVTPTPPSFAGYGEPATVTVSVSFDQVSWLRSPMFLGGTTLTASKVMRRETVQKGQPHARR